MGETTSSKDLDKRQVLFETINYDRELVSIRNQIKLLQLRYHNRVDELMKENDIPDATEIPDFLTCGSQS